ncbi:MAG: hypothetical protein Q7T01_02925 [bacterium]|nr:hypothetical protein [bacterium]
MKKSIIGAIFVLLGGCSIFETSEEQQRADERKADTHAAAEAACSTAGFLPPRPVWRTCAIMGQRKFYCFYCADERGVLYPVLSPERSPDHLHVIDER